MTDAIFRPTILASTGLSRPRFGWLAALARSLERAMIAEDTCRALDELPDKLLRDIGLTRGELPFIAGELVSGARMSAKQVSPGFRTRPECDCGRAGFDAAARSYPGAASR